MRRRLILAMAAVILTGMLTLGVPLAFLLQRVARAEANARLSRQAESVLGVVIDDLAVGLTPAEATLDRLAPAGELVLVLRDGVTVSQGGDVPEGETFRVYEPGPGGTEIVVEALAGPVAERVQRAIVVLVVLGGMGLGVSFVAAVALSSGIAEPLDRLAASARRLGSGDFSVTAPRSGLPEVDVIADALDESARRIELLVQAERQFSANASHQLRSALTGIRLRLEELSLSQDEDVRTEADAALLQTDRLTATVDGLLQLGRTGRAGLAVDFDLVELVRAHVADARIPLRRAGRDARVADVVPEGAESDGATVRVRASPGAVGQVLDVLLSNASVHGRGTVTVSVSTSISAQGRVASVDVTDEGSGTAAADPFAGSRSEGGHGIGLRLGRVLAESEGGGLVLAGRAPTTFRMSLPIVDDSSGATSAATGT